MSLMELDRRQVAGSLVAALALSTAMPRAARAASPQVIATFSILADLARNVGGSGIEVAALVGPDGDVHVYEPSPADSRALAAARLIILNGLGLEGWMSRLIATAASRAPIIVAARGVTPRKTDTGGIDPHAWQSVENAKIYVANIRDGLIAMNPAARESYEAAAHAYLAELDRLDADIRSAIAKIPPARRLVVTTHDAFGYFGAAYGISFLAPQGISSEAEPNARDIARIIRQIRASNIPAIFLENAIDPRMMDRIASESGARIGGKLFADSLSPPNGPAATYLDLMRHNLHELTAALVP